MRKQYYDEDEVRRVSAIENAIQKVRQAASIAGKKTGVAVETSKLRLQAVQINAMVQSTYERIGTLVYEQEKVGTDNYDLIAVCIKEVDDLLVDLNELNDRILALRIGRRCAACSMENPADTVYCRACGANLRKQRAARTGGTAGAAARPQPPAALRSGEELP